MRKEREQPGVSLEQQILDMLSAGPRIRSQLFRDLGFKSDSAAPLSIPESQLSEEAIRRKEVLIVIDNLKTTGQIEFSRDHRGKSICALSGQLPARERIAAYTVEKPELNPKYAHLSDEELRSIAEQKLNRIFPIDE